MQDGVIALGDHLAQLQGGPLAQRQTFFKVRRVAERRAEGRLALGEWSSLKLGEAVSEGYDAEVHVAPDGLIPIESHVLAIGWDRGHSPSAMIGQLIGGQVQVFAALISRSACSS